MMKRIGLFDESLQRLAQMVPQTPVKPKVISVQKYVNSGSGYTSPPSDYDEFLSTSMADMDNLWGGTPFSPDEVVAWLERNMGVDFSHLGTPVDNSEDLMMSTEQRDEMDEDEDEGPSVTGLSMKDIIDELRSKNLGNWDTTYNWGWWGPDMTFGIFSESSDPMWGEALVIVGLGTSVPGDSGKAYLVDSVQELAESAPFYDIHLSIKIETDQGEIFLDNEDDEAYTFSVSDENDLLGGQSSVQIDDLDDLLDWGGSSADSSINQ
jgi:hypothetical protein